MKHVRQKESNFIKDYFLITRKLKERHVNFLLNAPNVVISTVCSQQNITELMSSSLSPQAGKHYCTLRCYDSVWCALAAFKDITPTSSCLIVTESCFIIHKSTKLWRTVSSSRSTCKVTLRFVGPCCWSHCSGEGK